MPKPKPAPVPASDLVRDYLSAMENRDLEKARLFLASDFQMTFPGGVIFYHLEELITWSAKRYQAISKTYDQFDEVHSRAGAILYCLGKLAGKWPDGSSFKGIRFVDRFAIKEGKIADQKVWNDLAEYAALHRVT